MVRYIVAGKLSWIGKESFRFSPPDDVTPTFTFDVFSEL